MTASEADARAVGDRIEELLAGLQAGRHKDTAEELVQLLVEMYGEGLRRVVSVLGDRDPALVERLAEDELVESLLLLHDLHPVDADDPHPAGARHGAALPRLARGRRGVPRRRRRRRRAAAAARAAATAARRRPMTVQMAIEGAIADAAPELTGIEVAGVVEPAPTPTPLLQVGMGPPPGWAAAEPAPSLLRSRPRAGRRCRSSARRPADRCASTCPAWRCSSARSAARSTPTGTRCAVVRRHAVGRHAQRQRAACPSCGARFNVAARRPRARRRRPPPRPAAAAVRQRGRAGGGAQGSACREYGTAPVRRAARRRAGRNPCPSRRCWNAASCAARRRASGTGTSSTPRTGR